MKSFLRKSQLYGITYFSNEELVICFVEGVSGGCRTIGRERIPLETEGVLDTGMISEFRKKISSYQTRKPTWIHLVLRSVSFVKVFTLPETDAGQTEHAISNRIQAEIPYLTEEVILHQIIQEAEEGGRSQVLLFGISKNVLSEQMKKLEAYGIVPNRITLSTEALAWFYRTHILAHEKLERHTVFLYAFSGQMELLFFEDYMMLQSRWISQSGYQTFAIQEAIESSLMSYQREWRRKPDMILMGGEVHTLQMIQFDQSFLIKQVPSEEGQEDILLLSSVVGSRNCEEVYDYTLPIHKEIRNQISKTRSYSKLTVSAAVLAGAILCLALIQAAAILMQLGWFNYRVSRFSDSVREVRKMRSEASGVRNFYEKKSTPLLALTELREMIPEDVLLAEVEYDESSASLVLNGNAPQQAQIDQFISKLGRSDLFGRVKVERVQSERGERGAALFNFTVTCALKSLEAP